jgi:hypothetical protein
MTDDHDFDDSKFPVVDVRCAQCDVDGMQGRFNPADPGFDPDPHGNRRVPFVCPSCGRRGNKIVTPAGRTESDTPDFVVLDE